MPRSNKRLSSYENTKGSGYRQGNQLIGRVGHGVAVLLAGLSMFAASAAVTAVYAADAASGEKAPVAEDSRQTIAGGLQIESVIRDQGKAPTLELLQEGFVIECSARFESGCKLFLKQN